MYKVENGRTYIMTDTSKIFVGDTVAQDGEYDERPSLIVYEPVIDLKAAINSKLSEINELADTELLQGFNSSALGEEHHYRNDDKFPQWYRDNMAVQNSAARSDIVSWLTTSGDGWEMIDHTAEQFDQVFADLIAFEQPIEYKRLSLLEQAKGCETKEQLDNIQW